MNKPYKFDVTLILPCLNEERCIEKAVLNAQAMFSENGLNGEVLVVDNGSRDQTANLARNRGARVIAATRRGYGSALRAGFEAAHGDCVAFVDADLSYPIEELPKLLDSIRDGADLVLGNRLKGSVNAGAMPFLNRYFGTPLLSGLIRWRHRIPTYDCNSGFRVIRKIHLERMEWRTHGMEFASEMLVRAARAKLRYAEVPISFRPDQRGGPSHLRRWRDGLRHLRVILG